MVAVMVEGARLDENLRGIDGLCERWAIEAGDWPAREVNPIWRAMREREGASLPGGVDTISDDVAALDRVIAGSEPRYRAVVEVWYKTGGTVARKAKRLGTNRTDLYVLWRRTLEYLRGRLHAEGVNV